MREYMVGPAAGAPTGDVLVRDFADADVPRGAVRLVLPGELAKHADSEGTKAVTKFTSA
jgi:hypothetical protein